jgi:protein-tyrosine phosphatase
LQVTAGSVAGDFGAAAQELAERFLLAGQVTILASDAHNMKHRPPNLLPGLAHATELLGESAARLLVDDNPWRIARSHFANASAA